MLNELRYYSRMVKGVAQMQRAQLPTDPEAFVREKLLHRDRSFLDVAQRVIFHTAEHPFRRMFQLAGCGFSDLAGAVERDGLERTLLRLRHEGVYLSHDEWKGKTPIVRSGEEIPATTSSFRNPLVHGWLRTSSSGSTGRPVASTHSTDSLIHACVYQMLRAREFDVENCVWIDVKPILPFPGGLNSVLRGRRVGTPVERWFSAGSAFADHGHYRTVTRAMVTLGNLLGARAPYPSYLPHNDFSSIAQYAARRHAEGRVCLIHGFASPLVRVAAVALEKGYDISGSIFFCGGEALSPAKREVFESAGARAFSSYTVSEMGHLGSACRHMAGSSVHLFEDSVAAIGVRRLVPYADDAEMNSLHFTTLTAHAPNIFVNVELDDDGVIGTETCDCVYSRLGLTRSISRINSFGKANPQGITFHRTDLIEVLERLLPARLGGGLGDYQLVECEAANGQTQLRLHVSPRTGAEDCVRIREVFLEIMRPRWAGALATREWAHSSGIDVVIAEPLATATGKVHPVRLLAAYARVREGERTEVSHAS
jgi:hypothetical protein